jgi:hypothetical protein
MLINIKHDILGVPIVRLKTKEQKVKELFDMFKLPTVDYSNGYQAKPRAKLVGASASASGTEAVRLHAVNELRRWMRLV